MNSVVLGIATFFIAVELFASAISDPVVFVSPVKIEKISDVLTYPVRIESKIKASILSDYEGVVTEVLVPLGQKVKKGTALFKIEQTDPVFQYAPLVVRTSITGVVSAIRVSVGSRIVKGQELANVTDPSSIRGVMEVSSIDLQSVKRGMVGTLRIPGTEKKIEVKINGVAPQLDPVTGTATCELHVVSPEKNVVAPGQIGQVAFSVNSRDGIVLSESSLVYRGNAIFARVVKNDIAQFVSVKLGQKARGTAEILEGLKRGDVVIDRTSAFVADGAKVQVKESQDTSTKK